MVHAAKALAINMGSSDKAHDWRTKNNQVNYFNCFPLRQEFLARALRFFFPFLQTRTQLL